MKKRAAKAGDTSVVSLIAILQFSAGGRREKTNVLQGKTFGIGDRETGQNVLPAESKAQRS